jgi:hypothetical protein
VVESSGPENQRTVKGTVGSNPTPSSAKCVYIGNNEGYYLSYVDMEGAYHRVSINRDQLKLIAFQAVELITRGGNL